jgi:hypothetical protein
MGATSRMKLRILVAALLAAAVALIPGDVNAKGVTQVRISGPDLARPIILSTEAADLAQAAGLYSAFYEAGPPPVDPRLPSEDLGKRYTATYTFDVPEARTDRRATLRQELYPFAIGGSLSYTPPGQKLFDATSRGVWHRDARLALVLIAAGLPAPAPTPSQSVSAPVEATPRLTG